MHVMGAYRAVEKGMGMKPRAVVMAFVVLCLGGLAAPALAAPPPCGGDFGAWLQGVRQEAATQGISGSVIDSSLSGVSYDPAVIARYLGAVGIPYVTIYRASKIQHTAKILV